MASGIAPQEKNAEVTQAELKMLKRVKGSEELGLSS